MIAKASWISRIAAQHKMAEADLGVKSTSLESVNVDVSQRLVAGICSTDSLDLDNEIVVPSGVDTSYFPNKSKAVYFNHEYDELPVGTCRKFVPIDGGKSIFCQTFIRRGPVGDDLLMAIQDGAVGGHSVGYKVLSVTPPKQDDPACYKKASAVVRNWLALEYSIVSMPCNPDALVSLVSKGVIRRKSAVLFGLDDTPERRYFPVGGRALVVITED